MIHDSPITALHYTHFHPKEKALCKFHLDGKYKGLKPAYRQEDPKGKDKISETKGLIDDTCERSGRATGTPAKAEPEAVPAPLSAVEKQAQHTATAARVAQDETKEVDSGSDLP